MTVYSTRVIDLRANNIEIFRGIDRALNPVNCIAPQAQAAPPVAASGGFRLNTDLRPPILQKDCTLREATTFSESFANYMTSSPNGNIPAGQLWAHIGVNVDQHWLTLIKENHFSKTGTLAEFQKVLEVINVVKFPVNQRRVILLEARQKGEPLEFLRELIELARAAEWSSFGEESAICHLFLNSVKCDESKRFVLKSSGKTKRGTQRNLFLNYKLSRI